MKKIKKVIEPFEFSDMTQLFDVFLSEKNRNLVAVNFIHKVRSSWKNCVYETLNAHSFALDIRGKNLYVIADHKVFAHELRKYASKILGNISHYTGLHFKALKIRIVSHLSTSQAISSNVLKRGNTNDVCSKETFKKVKHSNHKMLEYMIQKLSARGLSS